MYLLKTAYGTYFICAALILLFMAPAALLADDNPDVQQIYSWKEKVKIYPSAIVFKAKLDSGAKTSSVNAIDIEEFERDGEEWVRFTIKNREDEEETLEREIVRHVRIKEHDGSTQRRAVVELGICMGRLYKEVEVNLVDRSHFTTDMLIGRSFMSDDVLVDPSTTYTHTPQCDRKSADE